MYSCYCDDRRLVAIGDSQTSLSPYMSPYIRENGTDPEE